MFHLFAFRSRRAALAAVIVGAVALSIALPQAAIADPLEVACADTVDYSFTLYRDGGTLTASITNLTDQVESYGLGAPLTDPDVIDYLWQSPFTPIADIAYETVQPGASVSRTIPAWSGMNLVFYRGIFTTPEAIASYFTGGPYVGIGLDASGITSWGDVSFSPAEASAGDTVTVTGSHLDPGAVDVWLASSGGMDGELSELVADGATLAGSGTVAADGTLSTAITVPAGLESGSGYTVMLRQPGGGAWVNGDLLHSFQFDGIPVVPGVPTIVGPIKLWGFVSADPGVWPSGTTFEYQWFEDGVGYGSGPSTIQLGQGVGTRVMLRVLASVPGHAGQVVADSAPSVPIPVPKAFGVAPTLTVTGTTAVGSVLTATLASTPGFTQTGYVWQRDGQNIRTDDDFTIRKYTLTAEDLGHRITVLTTGRRPGFVQSILLSDPTSVVVAGTLTPPANADLPKIAGTPKVGNTLTLKLGTWKPAPSFAIQWTLNGVAIPGATGTALVVPGSVGGTSTVGGQLAATVLVSLDGYTSVPVNPSAAGVVIAGTFSPKGTVAIVGAPAVGVTVTADPGVWDAAAALSYQWAQVSTGAVLGTGSTLVVPAGASGSKLKLTVTATADGYTTVTKTVTTSTKVP